MMMMMMLMLMMMMMVIMMLLMMMTMMMMMTTTMTKMTMTMMMLMVTMMMMMMRSHAASHHVKMSHSYQVFSSCRSDRRQPRFILFYYFNTSCNSFLFPSSALLLPFLFLFLFFLLLLRLLSALSFCQLVVAVGTSTGCSGSRLDPNSIASSGCGMPGPEL